MCPVCILGALGIGENQMEENADNAMQATMFRV